MGRTTKIGRPHAVTELTVIMLEHALKHNSSIVEATNYAGIGRTTYYVELARNPEFASRMDKAKRYLAMKARLIIADAILVDHDKKIAKWFLERRDPAFR